MTFSIGSNAGTPVDPQFYQEGEISYATALSAARDQTRIKHKAG